MGAGKSKVAPYSPPTQELVVIMADYDGCFDALFKFSPAVAGQTEDEEIKDKADLDRYSFLGVDPDDAEHIKALKDWLVEKTSKAETMLYCGSNRQSKKADLAVNAFKLAPRGEEFPKGKYPSMLKWINDQKLNEGFVGLCLKDYECLASVPGAILGKKYKGKPWWLVPSLLEDRLTGSEEGTEWGRPDRVSDEGAVTKFGQIGENKASEELEKPVVVDFDLFDTVTYHMKAPKKGKKQEEQIQKLAIMRHQLESMAKHVASGTTTYKSIQVYYIDDRNDLLDYVGPNIGVEGNTKLASKLGDKAMSLAFHTVNFIWRKGDEGDRTKPSIKLSAVGK